MIVVTNEPTRRSDLLLAGVELGGTKCICTLARGPDQIVAQKVFPTEDPVTTLDALHAVLRDWYDEAAFAALGIASFGPIDLDKSSSTFGSILRTNKPGWSMAQVRNRLSVGFDIPIAFDTDVVGAAISELHWGVAQDLSGFAYITVGTGVGVGLLADGRPTHGFANSELGHIRVPRLAGDDLPSACNFHDDCVEGLASGTSIKLALGARRVSDVGQDDPIWDRVVAAVGALCHAIVCSNAPSKIALGGGVISKQPHLLPRIEAELRRSLNGYIELPSGDYIVAPRLGDQAGALGPIALARMAYEQAGIATSDILKELSV